MRQVNRDELVWAITQALRTTHVQLRKQLSSDQQDKRRYADSVLAALIVDKSLRPYEIMTDAPEGPPCPVLCER